MILKTTNPKRNRRILAMFAWILGVASVFLPVNQGLAQDHLTIAVDPRVGLAAGYRNAGEAAHNMELVENLPRPEGFFDPELPSGWIVPPEQSEGAAATQSETKSETQPDKAPEQPSGTINFNNSDLAFSGRNVFVGSYHGFNVYREVEGVVEHPRRLELLASIVCPGGQGDVSVYGNLVFLSVEQTRGRLDCGTQGVEAPVSAERFRGVRIFDITDLDNPQQIAAVQTCRGSHTHTLVTNPGDTENLYIYGSGTSKVRSGEELTGCSDLDPEEDPNTSRFSIDVIQVPLNAPEMARIVNRPRIFVDPETGAIAGLWQGGDHGPGTQPSKITERCHDITTFPEIGLAAGACGGNGILLDISDPVNPVRLDEVVDPNFAFWHSATFNNDGSKVIFTDEWGGGARARCRETDLPTWGANTIFDIVDRRLILKGRYKMPAPQTEQENCVAHNGSIVPIPGRDIMAQAWYQGGVSIFDFTDSAHPVEIAYFDRGPLNADKLVFGGHWSTYWYNGYIYATAISRGIDVFRLVPSEHLSQNEIDAASLVGSTEFNAQLQERIVWPSTPVVARAYVDQLIRGNGIRVSHATAVNDALNRLEQQRPEPLSSNRSEYQASILNELDALAVQLEADSTAVPYAASNLRSLAATLTGLAARLR